MAESAPQPPTPENDAAANQAGTPPAKTAAPVKRKRRRWPFVLLGFLVLLIVLVLLAPTIASASLVRCYVIGKVNDNLNGTDPIENAVVLVYRLGSSGSPGTIKLTGIANITGKPLIVDEKLNVKSLPLQAANPFLSMAGQKRTLAGELNGAMDLKVTPDGQRI